MALTQSQLNQLIAVFPYYRADNWQEIDENFRSITGATTDQHFAGMLEAATEAVSWMQFLLETPDEILQESALFRRSVSVRPGNSANFVLEPASTVARLVGGITLANSGGATETVILYHCPAGVLPAQSDLIRYEVWRQAQPTVSSSQYGLGIVLLPGEQLICKPSTNIAISTYVAG